MIVVRRGRHKRSALFSDIDVWEHLFPGQKVDRISIDQMQPPPTRRQRNRMADTKVSKGRRFIKEQNQARKREIRYQKELGVDPWDEPFERKIDPRARTATLAVMRPEALIGNSLGKVFSRRRKTKNGKVVIENVRKRK